MSLIEFDDVSFQYRTQPDDEYALESVSCRIEREEFVGITGPSHAGKSTFCRCIPSYIPNFFDGTLSGTVTVDGVDARETTIGEMATTAGLLFENPFDQLTGASTSVIEEVAFGLENLGLPADEILERCVENLERMNIRDLIDRNPQQLSGGQSQRLALAAILAMQPEVLVLDEPASQLDPHGTDEVFDVISGMDDEGYTVILVSQQLGRMARHLDRLFVLDNGRLVDQGDPREVLDHEAAGADRVLVPDTVTVGRRLRRQGYIDRDRPLPLRVDEAVEELRPHVAPAETDAQTNGLGGSDERAGSGNERSSMAESGGDELAAEKGNGEPGVEGGDDEPAVVFDGVRFAYNEEIEALRGISCSFDGGCVCLVGQNGAGKSTFAKHLNGLLKPTEGTVRIRGTDTRDYRVAQLARDVGLSFQNPDDQLFHDSVEEEIRYGPRNLDYDVDRIDDLVEVAVERMHLDEVREKNPYDLGHSQRKRVAVASVLAMDTPIVVLDEPTGGQDAPGTRMLGAAVNDLVADGKLVVVITHDMSFACEHATRVVALGEGQILLDGTPREVFSRPDTLAKTDVQPPAATRIGTRLGLSEPALSVEDLLAAVDRSTAEE
ncbi:ABC transporter [Natronococcus pandeyae]|uniref:ABC transporter n=1 Tax=Natronococcus pandeyae TaxID=2055836 RepID=A0A8J8Q5R7_9EURY|nr:ABC transporter ATP-binding protein [Natronococcus pandeyae]TYL39312.1 ABC transporter [Natronococcus pandeyae]